MSSVTYDGKKLIPVQTVDIVKNYQKTGDGEIIGSTFSIKVNGTIVSYKGSPTSSGTFWENTGYPPDETVLQNEKLGAIIRKQEALRELFSQEGKSLEIQSADGSQPMKCNPRVVSVNIPPGQWVNLCPYTIDLEADVVYVNGQALGEDDFTEYISTASENWSIDTDDSQSEGLEENRVYRVSHTVSAQGKRFFDDAGNLEKPAWEQARDFVSSKLGFDAVIALSSGVNNLPSYYGGYNHVRSEQVDEKGGSYSVTESWILTSGTALETISFSEVHSIENNLTRVTVNGNITGLENRVYNNGGSEVITSKYDNALSRYDIVKGLAYSRAVDYTGISNLNSYPTTKNIGRNPMAGTINYTYEFDDRPSNFIDGALSEIITINDSWDKDIFGRVPVLGRTKGPVLQTIGTHHELTRSLTVEVVKSGINNSSLVNMFSDKPNIQAVVNAANPAFNGAAQTYVQDQTESWNPKTGRYSYNVTWVYEQGTSHTGGLRSNV